MIGCLHLHQHRLITSFQRLSTQLCRRQLVSFVFPNRNIPASSASMEVIRLFTVSMESDVQQQQTAAMQTGMILPDNDNNNDKENNRKKKARWRRHRKIMSRRKAAKSLKEQQQTKQLLSLSVPKLERENFETFFMKVAPQQNFSRIEGTLQEIEQCVENYKKELLSAKSKKGSLASSATSLASRLLELLHHTHPHTIFQVRVLEEILAAKRHISNRAVAAIKKGSPTKQEKEQLTNTLLAARDFVVQNHILWDKEANEKSIVKMVSNQEKGQDAAAATRLVHHLSNSLPSKQFRAFASMIKTYTDTKPSAENEVKTMKKQLPSKRLNDPVEICVGESHYHLVAKQVAKFFYFDPNAAVNDLKFEKSKIIWDNMKIQFVTEMLELQKELHRDSEGSETYQRKGSSISNDLDRDADAFRESISISKSVQKPSRSQKKAHLEFEAMPLLNYQSLEKHSTLLQPVNGMGANGHHLNGSSLNGDHGPLNGETGRRNPSLEKMVFVDNLPVDISEKELKDLYSRIGEIEKVDIFNLRPDLDPGELSKAETMKRRKRQLKYIGLQTKKWKRPKTPVYALIEFANEEGQRKALDDALRVFGMIIRRHPSRSIRPADMTSLFIEGIPDGNPCVDFEHELSRVLSPDYFVSLSVGQNNHALVKSCKIKFPSFESAYQSFLKLKKLEIISSDVNCRINWVRTELDAMDWYTKKLGF